MLRYWKWAALVLSVLFSSLVLFDLGVSLGSSCPFHQSTGGEKGASNTAQKHCSIKESATYGAISSFVAFIEHGEHFFVAFGTIVIATFTIALVASTTLLWDATRKLYEAGERQLIASTRATRTLISMERPYVTGGGDFENEWGKELFRLDVENHGKTAAFMTGYDLHFAKWADLQKDPKVKPVCENKFRHIDGISPQGGRKEIRTQRAKAFDDDVVYGAIYYRDIFGRPHHSRFILRIAPWRDIPGEGLTRLDVKDVSSAYWSWDIPKNEQT